MIIEARIQNLEKLTGLSLSYETEKPGYDHVYRLVEVDETGKTEPIGVYWSALDFLGVLMAMEKLVERMQLTD